MKNPINAPHLPPWIPPQQNSQPDRGDINSTGIERSRQQASVAAEGTILPIIYGEDFVGPIISLVRATQFMLFLRCLWCLGEIEEIVEVVDESGEEIEGMIARHYTGRIDQGVDPTLATIIPGYNDRCVVPLGNELVGVAYSVISIPTNSTAGFPRLRARIKGKKVRDPRGIPWSQYGFSQRLEASDTRIATAFNGTAHHYVDTKGTFSSSVLIADSAVGTVFGVINIDAGGIDHTIFDSGNGSFVVSIGTDNKLKITGKNSSSSLVLDISSVGEIPTTGTVAFIASWDVDAGVAHLYLGRENSIDIAGVSTGETINHENGALAVGGLFSGLSDQLNGKLAAFGYAESYYDLSLGENLNIFMDVNGRLKNPQITKVIWGPDGYLSNFTYAVLPDTVSEIPTGWTESTSPDPNNYAYQAYGGKGTFFKNDDPGYYISSLVSIQPITQRVYASIVPVAGGLSLESDSGEVLMSLDSLTPENVVTYPFEVLDGFVVKGSEAANEFVFSSVYVSPAPIDRSFKFYNLDDWSVDSGSPSVPFPGEGGVAASGTASITTLENLFLSGETVQYEFEVVGTFTGTVLLSSGAENILDVTEPGFYSGYFASTGTGVRKITLSWSTTGTATVKNMRIITNTINKVFTKTPSLMLADLIESRAYGLGGTVNDLSLIKSVQYNEEKLIGANDTRQSRHEVGVTMAQSQTIISWIETFRAYSRCFIVPRGNEYYLVKDSVVDPPYKLIDQSHIISGTFNLQKKSIINLPNVVKIYYTNTTSDPWTEDFVEAVSPKVLRGEEYRRESVLRMPGIQTRAFAMRMAIERLNDSTRIDLIGSFTAHDIAYPIEVGDVIKITHPIGLTEKLIRVLSSNPIERGKIGISFAEYDEDVYSSVIVDEPPPPDFGGLTPFQVPAVTGLSVVEEFYNSGAQTETQFIIGWDAVEYPFLQYYVLEIYENDIKIVTSRTPDNSYYLRNLQIEATYRVKVYAVSTAYVSGEAMTVNIVAQGYLIPPDFSQGKIVAFEAGDSVNAYVAVPAIDIDLWGYEWRYRQISDGHYFPAAGPNFDSTDWAEDVGDWTFGFKSLALDVSASFPIIRLDSSSSGIVLGKKYDIYVKVKKFKFNPSLNAFVTISAPGLSAPIPGGGNISFTTFPAPNTYNKPGLYVIRAWPGTAGTLDILVDNSSGGILEFELEYIAFREAAPDNAQDWKTAQFIDRSPSLNMRLNNMPTGDYLVYCRALDNVRRPRFPYGQYSEDIITDHTQILNDSGAFFRYEYVLANGFMSDAEIVREVTENLWDFEPSLPNPSAIPGGEIPEREYVGWICPNNGSSTSWNDIFTSPISGYSSEIESYFSSVTGSAVDRLWYHYPIDLGTVVRGKIIYFMKLEMFNDTTFPEFTLQYWENPGDAPSTITNFDPFNPTEFTARFVQLEVKWPSSDTNPKAMIRRDSTSRLHITAYPRIETGTVTTLGPDMSGDPQPVTVTLAGRYQSALSVRAWTSASTPIQCYVDNITFGAIETSFDIVALDINGIPTIVDAQWEWKGV